MNPEKITIRQATEQDAARISYLIARNTEKVLENNYSPQQVNTWKKANSVASIKVKLQTTVMFCAFQHDRLVGTIGLQYPNEVVGMYVSYSNRGRGIGGLLLGHLEHYAKKRGLKELHLTSTPSAKPFYLRRDFRDLGQVIVQVDGVDFYETKMKKSLYG